MTATELPVLDATWHITHRTGYRYAPPVRRSRNEVRLTPISELGQQRVRSEVEVTPRPSFQRRHRDYFGTEVVEFELDAPHDELVCTVESVVHMHLPDDPGQRIFPAASDLDAIEYLQASPKVVGGQAVDVLAERLRSDDAQATVQAIFDWLHEEITYEPGWTSVHTAVDHVLASRRGVCQDYAHLAIALLRSTGIPARYVSGYVAPKAFEVGREYRVDSHAWVDVLLPDAMWTSYDPTHHLPAETRHIRVGHGRDYGDVVPFRGVFHGPTRQELSVEVLLTALPPEAELPAT